VVIRHNRIVNTQLEIYRVRPGAFGSQSAEIYDNTFSAEGLDRVIRFHPDGIHQIPRELAGDKGEVFGGQTEAADEERSDQEVNRLDDAHGKAPEG
jgi:hypothetical protein